MARVCAAIALLIGLSSMSTLVLDGWPRGNTTFAKGQKAGIITGVVLAAAGGFFLFRGGGSSRPTS